MMVYNIIQEYFITNLKKLTILVELYSESSDSVPCLHCIHCNSNMQTEQNLIFFQYINPTEINM